MSPVESDARKSHDHEEVVELMRAQPFEAEVIVARLQASGIGATVVGADSVYPSLNFVDGVPILVAAGDAARARAVLEDGEPAD
jgi:hypothetical protein